MREKNAADKVSLKFKQWLHDQGTTFDACDIESFPVTGRGAAATRDIAQGEIVLQVPDDSVILAEQSDLAQYLDELNSLSDAFDTQWDTIPLVFTLVLERFRGRKSKWAPYLDFLPSANSLDLPFSWEQDDLDVLQGTSAAAGVDADSAQPPPANVLRVVLRNACTFFKRHPELGVPHSKAALRDTVRWAWAAVSSCAFILGDEELHGMVPMWDLLNHVTGRCNVRLNHDAKKGCLQMIATQAIAKGSELINNYGALSNGMLLLKYGFVEPRAPEAVLIDLAQVAACSAGIETSPVVQCSNLAHTWWTFSNLHDRAIIHLDAVAHILQHDGVRSNDNLMMSLDMMRDVHLIPTTECFWVDRHGELQPELAEVLRLCTMQPSSLRNFWSCLHAWAPGKPSPNSNSGASGQSLRFSQAWLSTCGKVLANARSALCTPDSHYQRMCTAFEAPWSLEGLRHPQQRFLAATIVSVGEWCCLDASISRLAGLWPQGSTQDSGMHVESGSVLTGLAYLLDVSRKAWLVPGRMQAVQTALSDQGERGSDEESDYV